MAPEVAPMLWALFWSGVLVCGAWIAAQLLAVGDSSRTGTGDSKPGGGEGPGQPAS